MSANNPQDNVPLKQQIFTFAGEFSNYDIEQRYLKSIDTERRRVSFWILIIAGCLYALAIVVDLAKLGLSSEFYSLLLVRMVFIGACFSISLRLRKVSSPDVSRHLSIAMLICIFCVVTVPLFRPADSIIYELLAVFIALFNYTAFPVGMKFRIIQGLLYAISLLIVMIIIGESLATLLSFAVLMTMSNVLGLYTASRFNHQSRSAWWHNLLLNEEISAHKTTLAAQQELEQQLRNQAYTDSLTGVHNRRSFFEQGANIMADPRQKNNTALLMFDLDFFKKVNDNYDHSTGDQVLKHIANLCLAEIRSEDTLARLGGEEFAILLKSSDAQTASERIRAAVAAAQHSHPDGNFHVTISAGLVTSLAAYKDLDKAIAHADNALYKAKDGGRNRIEIYN